MNCFSQILLKVGAGKTFTLTRVAETWGLWGPSDGDFGDPQERQEYSAQFMGWDEAAVFSKAWKRPTLFRPTHALSCLNYLKGGSLLGTDRGSGPTVRLVCRL